MEIKVMAWAERHKCQICGGVKPDMTNDNKYIKNKITRKKPTYSQWNGHTINIDTTIDELLTTNSLSKLKVVMLLVDYYSMDYKNIAIN